MRGKRLVRYIPVALFGIVTAALVIPFIYAAVFGLNEYGWPNGGSGPPVNAYFRWTWNIMNPYSTTITATVHTDRARLRKEIPGWFDDTVHYIPPENYSGAILPGYCWIGGYLNYAGGNVMQPGNKYHWDWELWNASASDGSSASRSGGKEGTYTCQ